MQRAIHLNIAPPFYGMRICHEVENPTSYMPIIWCELTTSWKWCHIMLLSFSYLGPRRKCKLLGSRILLPTNLSLWLQCLLGLDLIYTHPTPQQHALLDFKIPIWMSNHNQPLATNEPDEFWNNQLKFKTLAKITIHFRGIYIIYLKSIMKTKRITIFDRLDCKTLGFRSIMSKNHPNMSKSPIVIQFSCFMVDMSTPTHIHPLIWRSHTTSLRCCEWALCDHWQRGSLPLEV